MVALFDQERVTEIHEYNRITWYEKPGRRATVQDVRRDERKTFVPWCLA